MKKSILIMLFAIPIVIGILLIVATSNSDNTFVTKLAEVTGTRSKNLFVNADFNEGLKGWETDDNVQIVESNGTKFICLKGKADRVKIYQRVSVVSGEKYRLTYNFSGSEDNAAVIYYDYKLKQYHYKNCKELNNNGKYKWEIIPNVTTNTPFYFSIKGEGECTYSKISLRSINNNVKRIFAYLSSLLLLLFLIMVIIFSLKHANILFVTIILLMLILPILKISQETKSESENRNLALYKPLIESNNEKKK